MCIFTTHDMIMIIMIILDSKIDHWYDIAETGWLAKYITMRGGEQEWKIVGLKLSAF